ncbi:hypothetical protein LCGC14_0194640 [marine sediment metagenome]|uniref:Uncharacterized protein n=1 Tax=marine sediment metagenome TaxID=412755 RepID=A0A0F9V1N2_9ZZZZ
MSIADKTGRGLGNLVGGIGSKLQTFLFGQFLYVILYVLAFIIPVIILEVLVMNSNDTFQHLLMLPLAIFTFIPAILWHWPISLFIVGPAVGTTQMISLIWNSLLAAIGHLFALAASIILIPFMILAKFVILVLAWATQDATTPNNPISFSDIINLSVNECAGPYPIFHVSDYYLMHQLKDMIDAIGNIKIPGGGTEVCVDLVPGDFWPGDWDEGSCYTVPKHVRDVAGVSQMFVGIDAFFALPFPPIEAFQPLVMIVNGLFGWAVSDYSGLELMNAALYIKNPTYTSDGTLAGKSDPYFEDFLEGIIGAFLGCG